MKPGPLPHDDAFEKCRKVYAEFEANGSINLAAVYAGVHYNSAQRWLRNPKKYDPYIDEVALDRALCGEYEVYQNLSWWETAEFYTRLVAKREAMGEDTREWAHYKRMVREGVGLSETAFVQNLVRWGQRDVQLIAA